MATVLRVKRRCEDEPLEQLLISCKRKKIDDTEGAQSQADAENLHKAVVKFAGTFDNQDINIANHIKNQTKDDIKTNYKKPSTHNVIEKSRIKIKESSKQNRWKIINCSRSVNKIDDAAEKIHDNGMTIIDVEDCSTELPHDEAAKYVYDIYYTDNNNNELSFDNELSIHEMEEDWLVYDDYGDGETYNNDNPDDSDSNSESNWRTDYGDEEDDYYFGGGGNDDDDDEDDDEFINENKMRHAFNRCNIDDEYDLSTEDELSDDEFYHDLLDQADINIGGTQYAKFKAKLRLEEKDDDDDDDKTDSDNDLSDYSGPIITEVDTDDEKMVE